MYNKIFFSVIGLIGLGGFILPYLLSHKSIELPLLGVGIIIAVLYKAGQIIIQQLNKGNK